MRKSVIERAYDIPTSAHGGMVKTIDLIRRHFFWPGLVSDVRNYIRLCEIYRTTKAPNFITRPEMGRQITSSRPFQLMYIDILGPFPRSKQGNIGLLIVLDQMTKFHWLFPLKKFTSTIIQDLILKQIFHIFGVPETLLSDNGSQFKANDFNAFLTSLGIEHKYTAIYSPQSNASERVNRSILAGIRSYLKTDQTLWDQNLSAISCALRNSVHQSIQMSPYHAVFGFDMITHGSTYKLLKKLQVIDEPHLTLARKDELYLLRKNLKIHLAKAYETNRSQYNLRSRPISYSVGQEVYRRNFAQSNQEKKFNAKLAPLYLKSIIKEKVGNNYYILQDTDGRILGTYHAKDLRP